MKKKLILLLIMALSLTSYSQTNCNCSKTLEQLVIKVEHEYPGFTEKTKDSLIYVSFKKHLIEHSKTVNKDNCIDVLRKYTDYFRDGHLWIKKKEEVNSPVTAIDTVNLNLETFNKQIETTQDNMEGVWNSESYKLGIIKQDSSYVAFIISSKNKSWKPFEIKLKLHLNGKACYYMGDHSQKKDTYSVHKSCIIYLHNTKIAFVKESSSPQLDNEGISNELNELEGFYIKPISSKTILFKIASFGYSYTKRINKLIETHKHLLNHYENLIIDLRGNSGGTDYSYHPILPYIYTNPVRHLSGEYLVTQTLIDGLSDWAGNTDKGKHAEEIKSVRSDLKRMEGKIGTYIPYSTGSNFGFSKRDSVYLYPKCVAILIDGKCGSSTEKFLLDAKQSKKIKVFGTPTYGALDYVSVREFKLNCDEYLLYMPTVRMMRLLDYPLDNIGIQPDIYMDKYITDWVQYAKEYLEE